MNDIDRADRSRRWHLDWLLGVLIHPWRTFPRIAAEIGHVWLSPLLLISLTALLLVAVSGPVRQEQALQAANNLPPDFQYYSPDQQAQLQQGLASSAGANFIYVFPAAGAVAKVWLGWLVVGGLLHLVLTILGGRASSRSVLSMVAWAGLPFALRDIVRIVAVLLGGRLIAQPGLSGLVSAEAGAGLTFASQLLVSIDLYWIWHVLLLVIAVRCEADPGRGKAWASVLVTQALALLLLALPGYLGAQLNNLTIVRPFLF